MKKQAYAAALKIFVLTTALIGVAYLVNGFMNPDLHRPFITDCPPLPEPDARLHKLAFTAPDEEKGVSLQTASLKSVTHPSAKIQVAVLLDVSNSMDGLIEQAKAQLWNMVNLMGEVRCEGLQPKFELALFEYGRTDNEAANGFVKQLHPFTTDLDAVSSTLFGLKTNGGQEYCTEVIVQTADSLLWDKQASTYKVIFIAGNESFRQGRVPWAKACEKAKEKNIIVNTIFCGSREEGLRDYWDLGAECGSGTFTNIDQDAVQEDISTPYDSVMIVLNEQLNKTYLAFGPRGEQAALMQANVDQKNFQLSRSVGAKRVEAKAKSSVYNNEGWDLVDAMKADSAIVDKLSKDELPESIRNKTKKEIESEIIKMDKERAAIQKQIVQISIQRNKYIEKQRRTGGTNVQGQTLETEIEQIIRMQVQRFNMQVR